MADDLDKLRAAILRMQGWKMHTYWLAPDGIYRDPPDPLADDRLHELWELARTTIGNLCIHDVTIDGIRLFEVLRYYDTNPLGGGETLAVALARAIVAAKGGG